jgi:hypothetical protein
MYIFQPIPEPQLAQAQKDIDSFLDYGSKIIGDEFFKNKMHTLKHMLDDCEVHGCHLEALSAYPFENFQIIWKSLLRSGNKPMEQIRLDFAAAEATCHYNNCIYYTNLPI